MSNTDEKFAPVLAEQVGGVWCVSAYKQEQLVTIENEGLLDEVVIDRWFHLEQMEGKLWWVRIGDARVMVEISGTDGIRVDILRGFYGEISGETKVHDTRFGDAE